MKLGLTLFAVTALLLLSSPAWADTTAAAGTPSAATIEAGAASAATPAGSSCPAQTLLTTPPALAPIAPFSAAVVCGACSTSLCAGHGVNTQCISGRTVGRCVINSTCSPSGFQCICTSGPIP